jgi:nucleoside 2-deoxyribosyltransferase
MQIYITAPFKWIENKSEIENLCNVVKTSWFEDFCFIRDVEHYQKIFENSHELMQKAREEIEKCDALLIDFDGPASGRMIELGMAYALNKKIILIAKNNIIIKSTVEWVTDGIIRYEKLEDIGEPMAKILKLRENEN